MLNYIRNTNSVVLYWDLPENYKKGDLYEVVLGDIVLGETSKCHFNIKELSKETQYDFSVYLKKENKNIIVGECRAVTLKEKRN